MSWEYKVEDRPGWDAMLDRTLTFYGADGWELVTAVPYNASNLGGCVVRLIFKRPKDRSDSAIPKDGGR